MVIEDVRIDIDTDKYKTLKVVEQKVIVDNLEIVQKLLQIKTIDERMVYEMCQEIDEKELRTLIRVMQHLLKQMTSTNINTYK